MKKKKPTQVHFDSTSDSPETEQMYEWAFPKAPKVYYEEYAWQSIQYLVSKVSTEVGWLGLVETKRNKDDIVTELTVTDIYVPEQTVSGAETDISSEAMADLAIHLESLGKESDKLIYWGHSHVNMGVSPSRQDEIQMQEFLDGGCKLFVRGIYNKRGQSKVDVYDVDQNCIHQCVSNGPVPEPLPKHLTDYLDETIKENVKKQKTVITPQRSLGTLGTVQAYPALTTSQPTLFEQYGGYSPYYEDSETFYDVDGNEIEVTKEEFNKMTKQEKDIFLEEYMDEETYTRAQQDWRS